MQMVEVDFSLPLSNPFKLYEKLYESGASVCQGKKGEIGIFKYKDVENALKDPDCYSSIAVRKTLCPSWLDKELHRSKFIVMEDSPACEQNKKCINKLFVKSAIDKLVNPMQEKAKKLAMDFTKNKNFIEEFSYPYISFVLNSWLGTSFNFKTIKQWIGAIENFTEQSPPADIKKRAESAIKNQKEIFLSLIHERRKHPADDFISEIIKENGDTLNNDDLLNITQLLVSASFHTTVHLLSQIVILLTRHKTIRELLKHQPERLIPLFIDEVLRFFPTMHVGTRETTKKAILSDGHEIEKGTQIKILHAAANRDPSVFNNPYQFDIFRSNNKKHLSFGAGPHVCLGIALAHTEMCIATDALLKYFPLDHYTLKDDENLSIQSQVLLPNMLGLNNINEIPEEK